MGASGDGLGRKKRLYLYMRGRTYARDAYRQAGRVAVAENDLAA